MKKSVLEVLNRRRQAVPPVWLMRQAGRYLPEYRALREKAGSFLKLCFTPEWAAEVTLQPLRRFDFDAAILFSDILVVPYALGRDLQFVEGEGPRLEPVGDRAAIANLPLRADRHKLAPIYETVREVKAQLAPDKTLIGFCGAPWTVATYMIAGRGTPDQMPARQLAADQPEVFRHLIDRLTEASIDYLLGQLDAGADALQIFDTWAGVLAPDQFERWSIQPTKKIIDGVRALRPEVKVIGFPRGAKSSALPYAERTGVDAIGLDAAIDRQFARERLQTRLPVQGNLDPEILRAGGSDLDRATDEVLATFAAGPFIFNLGHGILPDTPIVNVERMLKRIRG